MNLTRIAEATGMTIKEASYHRAVYLKKHLGGLAESVAYFEDRQEAATGDDRRLCELFTLDVLGAFLDEARELQRLTRAIKGKPAAPGRITDEQIAAARAFPIEQMVDFVKGKAPAPCHEDKTPSLSWDRKRNKAHCFATASFSDWIV
jgi:hypothetical protein